MNQLPPVGSHQTGPFASQDVSAIHATERERITELERQIALLTTRVVDVEDCHDARIEKLETAIRDAGEAIVNLGVGGIEMISRIEQLETCATLNAETIGHVAELRHTATGQDRRIEQQRLQVIANAAVINRMHDRIEKLGAALADVARCLVDGDVDRAMQTAGELHRHRILGTESVQAMVEVYHRLKK